MAEQKESVEGEVEESNTETEVTVCQFFQSGNCRFGARCRNLHVGEKGSGNTQLAPKHQKKKKEQTPAAPEKKPPMKTAVDVISRIQWDSSLLKNYFTVGYLDRFLGVIEKPFTEFSWEDLASVEYGVLAVPKHRIQYFKYRDVIVWDKTNRIDDVFGSTGGGKTILDVIENYEKEHPQTQEGAAGYESMEREPAGTSSYCPPQGNEDEDDAENRAELSTAKKKPNYFIAVRISNEEVRMAVKEIQNHLIRKEPELAECCVPVSSLHLTLCLLHLDSQEAFDAAYAVLHDLKSECQRLLPPTLILNFHTLQDFHSHVLYVAPVPVPELVQFMETLAHRFTEKGIVVIKPPSYANLHVTIAKIPKLLSKKNPELKLAPELYKDCPVTELGSQAVDCLAFCFAGKTRRTDGFFTTLMSINLY
ncbi:leukocyte receptor cluster member 9 [Protopterus annectens]|uniref:leukocyte receptor cluster member 9 n=1 Tax=Protopterus annectens TaxID=7888 RepID=UPI001CFA9E36|nr:leukocyte receptor cluster member 9 [Protopterus annectens]XP_043937526.1 leukocyte receptor cluster member 9 [Protopterus annectens]